MIDTIVVHTSASPQGRGDDAESIHRWHQQKGWDGIGYHYVLLENGEVQTGRPEYWTGAHVGGQNSGKIGICLIGEGGDATDAQMQALAQLCIGLNHRHNGVEVVGHADLDPVNKAGCPGFNVKAWWQGLSNA